MRSSACCAFVRISCVCAYVHDIHCMSSFRSCVCRAFMCMSCVHAYVVHSCVCRAFMRMSYIHAYVVCSCVCRGGRRSPAVAFWASDHWVASLNPLRGKFRH